MARRKCRREIEMAIFAARTKSNLPVSHFQTWQVCRETRITKLHLIQSMHIAKLQIVINVRQSRKRTI